MRFLVLLLAAALIMTGAAAEEILLDEDGILITLNDCGTFPGGAELTVTGRNSAEEERELLLLVPEIDGDLAAFEYGWASYAITLPAGGEISAALPVTADDPEAVPSQIKWRFALGGRISSACELTVGDEAVTAVPASFILGAQEPPLVDREIDAPRDDTEAGRTLTDALSDEEMSILDYGQALIFVRAEAPDGEKLMHICTVEASTDADGNVTADYSGLALALADDDAFVVPTAEAADVSEDMTPWTASLSLSAPSRTRQTAGIALSGDAAFYASLGFHVDVDDDGSYCARDIIVSSAELGGDCVTVPCALFDTVRTSLELWSAEAVSDNGIRLMGAGANISQHTVDAPLRFRLIPAGELGDIVYCFEYFFTDGSDTVRPIKAMGD